jgi:hypothetical protein
MTLDLFLTVIHCQEDLVVIREKLILIDFTAKAAINPASERTPVTPLMLGVHTPARITFRSWFLSLRIVGTRLAVVIE